MFIASLPQGLKDSGQQGIQYMFNFDLDCNGVSYCEKAKTSIRSALNRISSVLALSKPISASITFEDICSDTKAPCLAIGYTRSTCLSVNITSTEFSTISKDNVNLGLHPGAVYRVPLSLVRQSDIPYERIYILPDMNVFLNAKTKWWFKEDNVPLKDGEIDLEFTVLHEVVHGLGFGDSSFAYSEKLKETLLPIYGNTTAQGNYKFSYPSLWDSFLKVQFSVAGQSKSQPWLKNYEMYNDAVRGKVKKISTEDEFRKLIKHNSKVMKDAKWRYELATTPNTIVFVPIQHAAGLPKDFPSLESPIYIHTKYKRFEGGSSLVHLASSDDRNFGDFLMLDYAPSIALSDVPGF
ncbi:hypothetical protein HMI56_004484, partial [Coelomomyces lativittatus]